MRRPVYNLHCSRALSLPLIGRALYDAQLWALNHRLMSHFWVSRKADPRRDELFHQLLATDATIFCSAWQLGHQLRPLQNRYVFRYSGPATQQLTLPDLYNVQWAIIFAHSITEDSVEYLGTLLPASVPLRRKYVVSVLQPLDVSCDFIKQTINQLSYLRNDVLILSQVPQPPAVRQSLTAIPGIELLENNRDPFEESVSYRLRQIFDWCRAKYVATRVRIFADTRTVLWCFDPDDAGLLGLLPQSDIRLYDCVDYYTSVDPELKKQITDRQVHLLKHADLIFVNSQTLQHLHSTLRSDITLVPQGFDQAAFEVKSKKKDTLPFFRDLQRHKKRYQHTVSYAGALSYRINYPLLIGLIQRFPNVLFCLPETKLAWQTEDDALSWQKFVPELQALPNVIWYPRLRRQQVRLLLEQSDVGLIPYDTRNEFNTYCFPMKLFEHFNVGLPTLSTPIAELKYYSKFVKVGRTVAQLANSLEQLLAQPLSPAVKNEMRRLSGVHSWPKKIAAIQLRLNSHHHWLLKSESPQA